MLSLSIIAEVRAAISCIFPLASYFNSTNRCILPLVRSSERASFKPMCGGNWYTIGANSYNLVFFINADHVKVVNKEPPLNYVIHNYTFGFN